MSNPTAVTRSVRAPRNPTYIENQLERSDPNFPVLTPEDLKAVAIVGDPTSHGGMVISGSPTHKVNGLAVARKGDMVDCPQYYPDGRPHGRNAIIEGSTKLRIDGLPAALHGHHSECGCELLAVKAGAPVPSAGQYRPPNETDEEKKARLFGANRPDLDRLAQDPTVRAAMDNAWNQTLHDGLEHGGWIMRDPATNELYTMPFQGVNGADSIYAGPMPADAIASFHTHPIHAEGGFLIRVPSGGDIGTSAGQPLSGIVRSEFGNYFYGPQNAPPVYPNEAIPGMDQATYTLDEDHINDLSSVTAAGNNRIEMDKKAKSQGPRPTVAS
jgi:uncharacterized Zn-binding protein involved in type VI secretion